MRRADLGQLTQAPYDVLVVGGGIYGLMAARDAALRGLRTALVEQADWGGGSSHNSLKLMHGGIRYVQHLDFARLRASARERAFWLRAAPDLVRPLEFTIPMFGLGIRGPLAFGAAALLYNLASRGPRGSGFPGAGVVPPYLARRRMGDLAPPGLSGGGIWSDGQIVDVNGLHLSVLTAVLKAGGDAANYMQAEAPCAQAGQITGARVRDMLTGGTGQVAARVVLSCTGIGAADFAASVLPEGAQTGFPGFARAMNLVVRRRLCTHGVGIVSRARSDAVVERGGRMYFLTPWKGHTIIGTHEAPFAPGMDPHHPDPQQVALFLEEINHAAPMLKLRLEDIVHCHCGVIPADIDDAAQGVRRQTRGTLIDHAQAGGPSGLISVSGVKYTTARLIAERAVTLAAGHLGRRTSAQIGFTTALPKLARPQFDPALPETLRALSVHAVRHEMAATLADVVLRRCDLIEEGAPDPAGGVALAELVAEEMAPLLGWSRDRVQLELSQIRGLFAAHSLD